MAGSYAWLTYADARASLAARLSDPSNQYWSDAENGYYLIEALRMFNCLTGTWRQDFSFTPSQLWNPLGATSGSPRLRTVTDTWVYTLMEYMLLEPPSGGTWEGTSMFAISDLSLALQRRRDEILKVTNCNQALVPDITATIGARRTTLPDTAIDMARARWVPEEGSAVTLVRNDLLSLEFYESGSFTGANGTPSIFSVLGEPPLSFDVDVPPAADGSYEAILLQSGAAFDPPSSTLIGIPDDFAWAARMGALADLLGMQSEAKDPQRAAYCAQRFQDALTLMLKSPWIMVAKVNGVPVALPSLEQQDSYSPEWDSSPASFDGGVVCAGMDLVAAPVGASVVLTLLGNAPVPSADDDYVQVARENWDTVLDLAQSMACFKMGGTSFQAALELEARAIRACSAENVRLRSMGIFPDVLAQRAQIQDRTQERYSTAEAT